MAYSVPVIVIYAGLALAACIFFGSCATKIFRVSEDSMEGRIYQFWFNFLGSGFGWAAGWPLLNHFLDCATGRCEALFGASSLVLLIVAFVGMTGHLPLATMTAIEAVREVANWARQALSRDKPP
jgi:hypothetical protein